MLSERASSSASRGVEGATLTRRAARLEVLVRFAQDVQAVDTLTELVRLLCQAAQVTSDCTIVAGILRDPQRKFVDEIEAAGWEPELARDLWEDLVERQGRTTWAGRPRVMRLSSEEPDGKHDQRGWTGLRAMGMADGLAVALQADDDLQGLVLLGDRTPRERDADEIRALETLANLATAAIRNLRARQESARDLLRRDALRRVVESISSELDLGVLLGRVVAEATQLLGAAEGAISLIERGGELRIRASYGTSNHLTGQLVKPSIGMAGQVLAQRRPVLVRRYMQDLPSPLLEMAHVYAGIGVPILWHGQLVGVIAVFADKPSRTFGDTDRDLLEMLASHVSIAIENARLYGQLRERLAEVTGLQAASAAAVEQLDPARALRTVAEQARVLSGASTVSIELLGPDEQELEVEVAVGEDAAGMRGMRFPVEGSVAGTAASTGRPQIVRGPGVTADEQVWRCAHSLLVLPLRARGRTLGTLSAYTEYSHAFHSRQVELLATFAHQASISLDNARLYAELQHRLEEIMSIHRLGSLLLEEHDFDSLLSEICLQLQRLTDAGGVGIALLTDTPGFLEMQTVVGPSANVLKGARIPTDGSFAGEALRTDQPQRSNDAQNDPRGNRQSLVLGHTRSILSVPMKTRRRAVGVLSIYNKRGEGGFSDRDADLATLFANQAGVAIENVRLYEQTREYAVVEERNRLSRELHDSVTQSLFSVTLLSQAALSLWDRDTPKARERLERANEVAQGALAEMRALIFELRPTALRDEGLVGALKKHVAALKSREGLDVQVKQEGQERRLTEPVEQAAFRIVQESLNNVVKHAQVPRAQVTVRFAQGTVRVCTRDKGVGFQRRGRTYGPGMGTSSMRERAEAIGGTVTIRSRPGLGTTVCAELPAPEETEDGERD